MQNKKIGLIIFWYPLGVSPTLINLIELLAEKNIEINVFIDEYSFNQTKVFFNKNIKIHRIVGIPSPKESTSYFQFIHRINTITSFIKFYKKISQVIDNKYEYVIGVDTFGIIAASFVAKTHKIPLVYFNLELLLSSECKTIKDKIIKFFEKGSSRQASLIIIQDEKRGKYLVNDNNLDTKKMIYFPVSIRNKRVKKSDFLREKFKIPKNKKLILYAGEIDDWTMSKEIVQSAQSWDDEYVLIMHASRTVEKTRNYIDNLKREDKNNKVIFSLNPVEWQDVSKVLSSADIGLAFYKDLGKNFTEIGSASGKMASYLQVGLPVIVSDYPSLRKIVEENKCGKYAKDPREILRLLREIFKNYTYYHQNALRCYKIKYDVANYFQDVYQRLEKLEKNARQF